MKRQAISLFFLLFVQELAHLDGAGVAQDVCCFRMDSDIHQDQEYYINPVGELGVVMVASHHDGHPCLVPRDDDSNWAMWRLKRFQDFLSVETYIIYSVNPSTHGSSAKIRVLTLNANDELVTFETTRSEINKNSNKFTRWVIETPRGSLNRTICDASGNKEFLYLSRTDKNIVIATRQECQTARRMRSFLWCLCVVD